MYIATATAMTIAATSRMRNMRPLLPGLPAAIGAYIISGPTCGTGCVGGLVGIGVSNV
jgi:hypothetical protein